MQKQLALAVIRHQRKLINQCGTDNLVTSKLIAAIDAMRRRGFCQQYIACSSRDLMLMFAKKIENAYTEAARIEASRVNGSSSSSTDKMIQLQTLQRT